MPRPRKKAAIHPPPAASLVSRRQRPIRGRYELKIVGEEGALYFANSLAEVARQLSKSTNGQYEEQRLLLLLHARALRGELVPNGRGFLFYLPALKQGAHTWIARVRGARTRAAPKFSVGQCVSIEATTAQRLGNIPPGWVGYVSHVEVTDHGSDDKVYRYQVGKHLIRENLLRAIPDCPSRK